MSEIKRWVEETQDNAFHYRKNGGDEDIGGDFKVESNGIEMYPVSDGVLFRNGIGEEFIVEWGDIFEEYVGMFPFTHGPKE